MNNDIENDKEIIELFQNCKVLQGEIELKLIKFDLRDNIRKDKKMLNFFLKGI